MPARFHADAKAIAIVAGNFSAIYRRSFNAMVTAAAAIVFTSGFSVIQPTLTICGGGSAKSKIRARKTINGDTRAARDSRTYPVFSLIS